MYVTRRCLFALTEISAGVSGNSRKCSSRMGRCGRVRERRRAADHPHCCHITEQKYIDLVQWMKLNGFDVRHCHLRPAKFTGKSEDKGKFLYKAVSGLHGCSEP